MSRRGAILFEMLLALGVFTTAAALTLRATGHGLDAVRRAQERRLALDVARSKLAELEAGLVTLTQLRDGEVPSLGSLEPPPFGETRPGGMDLARWRFDVRTEPTPFSGLTLVTLSMYEAEGDGPPLTTLRSLVELGSQDGEGYEADDLLEDLPTEEEPW